MRKQISFMDMTFLKAADEDIGIDGNLFYNRHND